MRRFVVGDIHGAHKALLQCFERAGFDSKNDLLISLGDICDGWPEVDKVIDELLNVKYLKVISGNHDAWALRWIEEEWAGFEWTSQGGQATIESYHGKTSRVPASHHKLLQEASLYIELEDKLFVHGGVDMSVVLERQDPEILRWDRTLIQEAMRIHGLKPSHRFGKWKEIYIGHTPTIIYGTALPIHACNVWALDTGGGWDGKLTLMDVDSHEYWQSDEVPALYPNSVGRRTT